MNQSKKNPDLNKHLLNAIMATHPEPFFVYDRDGRYIKVLGGHDRSKYHDAQHLIGKTLHEVLDFEIAEAFLSQIHKALQKKAVVIYSYQLGAKDVKGFDGTPGPKGVRWFEAHIYPISLSDGEPQLVVWMAMDITELKQTIEEKNKLAQELVLANEKLRLLSNMDGLTKIYNRRYFDEAVEKFWRLAQRDNRPLSLILFDLDHFKRFNDYYGHQKGDECLKVIAKTASENLQRAFDIFCRYGGEEFIIILLAPVDTAVTVAERIRQAVEALQIPHRLRKERVVTISLGVSCITPTQELTHTILIEQVDKALYKSKRNGRNRVTVYSQERI